MGAVVDIIFSCDIHGVDEVFEFHAAVDTLKGSVVYCLESVFYADVREVLAVAGDEGYGFFVDAIGACGDGESDDIGVCEDCLVIAFFEDID